VSCFVSSLDEIAGLRQLAAREYPNGAIDFIQSQRSPVHARVACEAVARLAANANPGPRFTVKSPENLPRQPGISTIALVASSRVIFTGTQLSFGFEEKDARLAFERIGKELKQSGASLEDAAFVDFYPLASQIAAQILKVGADSFDPAHPPAGSLELVEGLSSMNAGFAMDVVAVK
jgi:hypothetical protein